MSYGKCIEREVRLLRIVGLHSMGSIFTDKIAKTTRWESVSFAVGLITLFLFMWFRSTELIDVWSTDSDKVIFIILPTLSGALSFIKGSRIWFCREELRQLLRRLIIMWDQSHGRGRIREQNMTLASQTRNIGTVFIIMLILTCLSYAIRPFTFLLHYHRYDKYQNISFDYTATIFSAKYPWSTETPFKYTMCIFWEQFVIILIALYTLSADMVFAQFTTHAAIQFQTLQDDFKRVTSQLHYGERDHERLLIHRLSTLVERHCDLFRYCERIIQTYKPIIFMTLVLTAAKVCLCTFQLQKTMSKGDWYELPKYLFHGVVLAAHTSIYCGYAESLSQQSTFIAQAAYECDWFHHSREFKVMLHIIVMRAQKPINSGIYGLSTPNARAVAMVFKAAASYFTLLKSVT